MSEWRMLKSGLEVFQAKEAGEEIETKERKSSEWDEWPGFYWYNDAEYRARPIQKKETVTLRKALLRYPNGVECVSECNEKYVKHNPWFVGWIGEPVTYEVEK